jgi:Transposase domain (DUF772)
MQLKAEKGKRPRKYPDQTVRKVGVSGFLRIGARARIAHDSHCRFERDQLLLLPEAVDDYVDSDNPVRFIDAFVDGLDLAEAGFGGVAAKATGRPGYAPGDLLKLNIYGYLNRVRSSRRLEREAHRSQSCQNVNPEQQRGLSKEPHRLEPT